MPGVPSSRGCDACRKQKKKCDGSKIPCSRCSRLQIACVGCGEQRYKFQNQSVILTPTIKPQALQATPSNEMTTVASAFLAVLEVTDIRFDISIYGDFLKEIPRRLGTNEALDASVCALATAFSSIHSRQQSTAMLNGYGKALNSLRVCLNDPAKAQSPDTLCALYLVMICQGWIGNRDDKFPSHGEAMAQLLSIAVSQNWQGKFETEMLVTLCAIVVLESFINPRIRLDPWIWKLPETFGPCSPADRISTIESLKSRNIAKIPPLIRDPDLHLSEIQSAYQTMRADCAKMGHVLSKFPTTTSTLGIPITPLPHSIRWLHVRYQTGYGITLCRAIMLNGILCVYEPLNLSLAEESATFVDEVINLAENASQYRPLGSSSMPLCLVAALAATDDVMKQERLDKLLAEYQTDFASARWLDMAFLLRAKMGNPRLDISAAYREGKTCTTVIATEEMALSNRCITE